MLYLPTNPTKIQKGEIQRSNYELRKYYDTKNRVEKNIMDRRIYKPRN